MRHDIDRIEMDTVFRIWSDGVSYEILPDEQGPEVYGDVNSLDITIDSILSWFTVTNGMSGQYGYDGPVMHNSEFISSGMVESILGQYDNRTHYFVVTPVWYDDEPDGWVILAREVTS